MIYIVLSADNMALPEENLNRLNVLNSDVCILEINPLPHNPNLMTLNPFLNNRILDMTKLKAFADEKLNVAEMIIYLE